MKNTTEPVTQRTVYCLSCGRQNFTYDGFKSFACSHCGFVLYHNAAAAVMAVLQCQGKILLCRRAHDPACGRWDLPGGFVDPGESAEAAMRREIREEMNLELGRLHYLGTAPNVYEYGAMVYPTCDVIFTADIEGKPLQIEEREISQIELVRPGDIDESELAFPSNVAALQLYLRHIDGKK